MKTKLLSLVLCLALLCVFSASLIGCADKDKTITVGATSVPHAEVLENCVAEILKEKGYTLVVNTYGSYELINPALAAKDLDANFFQHRPYLDDCNAEDNTDLFAVCTVHYEPLGIYTKASKTLVANDLQGATIAIPNDATNRARALNLLAANGIITLSKNDLTVTVDDITANTYGVTINEVTADSLPTVIGSVDFAVLNGNYALAADLSVDSALAVEDKNSTAADTYANVLVVNAADKDSEKTNALVEALADARVKAYYESQYGNAAIYNCIDLRK